MTSHTILNSNFEISIFVTSHHFQPSLTATVLTKPMDHHVSPELPEFVKHDATYNKDYQPLLQEFNSKLQVRNNN
jgi:hypothetical protein